MPTLTTNFDFNKPNINSADDEDLWGDLLNDNWDAIDGYLAPKVERKTASFSVTAADFNKSFEIDSSAGAVTVSLPASTDVFNGFYARFRVTDATNPITLSPNGSDTINGGSSLVLTADQRIEIVNDGVSAWTNFALFSGDIDTGDGTPAGIVCPFAGTAAPSGYLECDGSAVSRTTYATLYGVVGDIYGNGDGSTTFNLPDYRGEFLRGFDNGAGNDPDAASRTDRGDGTTGDAVGTKQTDEFEDHIHREQRQASDSGVGFTGSGSAGSSFNPLTGAYSLDNTTKIGGDETRPRNVSVMYVIKT